MTRGVMWKDGELSFGKIESHYGIINYEVEPHLISTPNNVVESEF